MQNKTNYFLRTLAIIVIGLIAWYFKTIVIYVCIAIIISLIGQPLVRLFSSIKIKKYKLPNSVAALLGLACIVSFFILLASMFVPLVIEEARIIRKINPNDVITAFSGPIENIQLFLQKFQIQGNNESIENYLTKQLSSIFTFQEVSAYAQGFVSITASLIGGTFAVLFMAFFFMKDEHFIYNTVILLTPAKHIEAIKTIMKDTKRLLTKYFIGILLDVLFVTTLTTISLNLLGIKNSLLIGLFAGLMNIIPYIGPLIAAAFGILIGITTNLELEFYTQLLPLIYKMTLVFFVVQLIDSIIFQPIVISNIVKAHPLEIFLVILIAGTLGGITGMIIAVPVYTILRIIAKEFLNNFKIIQKLTVGMHEKR